MTSPMRLNPELVSAAEKESVLQKRSVPKQIEFWAELGRIVAQVMDLGDVVAVSQGIKKLHLEPVVSQPIDPSDVFNSLETSRIKGGLSKNVTSSVIYYEASLTKPGYLDRVNTATGERQTGRFHDGKFYPEK